MLMIASVALVIVAALVLWYSPLRLREKLGVTNFFGAMLLAAWIAAVASSSIGSFGGASGRGERPVNPDLSSAMRSLGDVDWERSEGRHPAVPGWPAAVSASAGPTDVAPVDSLIGGLEARLSAGPADAKGWALLAQSYAFVGQTDRAESALVRAVELGFDEAALRARIAAATRGTGSSVNWIEQTLRR